MTSPPSAAAPILFDPALRRARLKRARARFASADFLHRRAALHAVEDLGAILRGFEAAVDLSAHGGVFAAALAAEGVRNVTGPVRRLDGGGVQADPGGSDLPWAEGSADLAASVLSLHWANDLPGALIQIRRLLRPDGLFLGSLLGGATLTELRQVLTQAELEMTGGAQPRVSPFADGFDGAALLQRAGFALPAVDVDRVTVRYGSLLDLVRDLRAMGETSALAERGRRLNRNVFARAAGLYAERFSDPDGRLRATFEIIHLTGWAPHDSQPKPARRGSATVRLADALNVRERTGDEDD